MIQILLCILSVVGYYLIREKPRHSYIVFVIQNILAFMFIGQYYMIINIIACTMFFIQALVLHKKSSVKKGKKEEVQKTENRFKLKIDNYIISKMYPEILKYHGRYWIFVYTNMFSYCFDSSSIDDSIFEGHIFVATKVSVKSYINDVFAFDIPLTELLTK